MPSYAFFSPTPSQREKVQFSLVSVTEVLINVFHQFLDPNKGYINSIVPKSSISLYFGPI